jgi:hypothetical protein
VFREPNTHSVAWGKQKYWEFRENAILIQEINLVVEGKAIPSQALAGPEGSKRLRVRDFKTICT